MSSCQSILCPPNRLTAMTRGGAAYQAFPQDALGNANTLSNGTASSTSGTFNGQNQLTTFGGATLGYDPNGNTPLDDQGHHLIYDAWNRLIQVNDAGGNLLAAYASRGRAAANSIHRKQLG